MDNDRADYTSALLRHFVDLRDGTHGGVSSRSDKEKLFVRAVGLLDPHAQQVLDEVDARLLLGAGTVSASGPRTAPEGGTEAVWELTWPEQQRVGVSPVTIRAFYGSGFHHPHLEGATVGVWPLNVFDEEQAAAEAATMRAIAAADLHNLVFQRDYRIVPATTSAER